MRILILNHEYPPVGGGGGQAAQDIARELSRRGHEIYILTAHFKGLSRDELVDNIHILRYPSLRNRIYRAGFLTMAAYILAAIRAGLKLIRRWHPDIIHAHFAVPAGAAAWVLARLTGIPYVVTAHLGDIPGGVPEKTGRWFRWVFPFTVPIWQGAARIVTVSEFTKSLIQRNYDIEPVVIPNGISIETQEPKDLEVHNPPMIIFAGRFMPQKNLVELVETLAEVQDIPWKCTMLGDGPLMDEIRNAIKQNHLDERFFLPGWVTTAQVLAYFSQSDLLFMPSLSEGLPVVGLQALAKGLAIVASRAGGNVELVEPGYNGFLVDPGDKKAYTDALRTLLSNNNALAKARSASLEIALRFDLKTVADHYEKIFREIVFNDSASPPAQRGFFSG
jgi:glycosyltransferase involved in cell wall biosynthesis